jgi:hypothetical protein
VQIIPLADLGGSYVDWSVFHISVTNLAIIAAMILIFLLALVLPFPGHDHQDEP